MKKILSMLLVFAMMFGILACGASKPAEVQASTEVRHNGCPDGSRR